MKKLLTIFCICATFLSAADDENFTAITVAGKFQVIIPAEAGHQTPIVEFLRRFERIVRYDGKFSLSKSTRSFTVVISDKQTPGTYKFVSNKIYGRSALIIPNGLRQLLSSPEVGRALTSALIQSHLGNTPSKPLPEDALWIADGLWAEFVQREIHIFPILHFTYLENLRKLAESGYKLQFRHATLLPPKAMQINSPLWTLYTQRAQLMIEVSRSMAPGKHGNLLKDYIFLLNNKRIKPEEAFTLTFANAAYKKVNGKDFPAGSTAEQRMAWGHTALEKLAMRNLFSGHAPMNPATLLKHLEKINTFSYRQKDDGQLLQAHLEDLPLLLKKYKTCSEIPRRKIMELRDFIALVPLQLRGDVTSLNNLLATIYSDNPQHKSAELQKCIGELRRKLIFLQRVDRDLEHLENLNMPRLYYLRYTLNSTMPQAPLPENISRYLDEQQKKLQQD